MDDDEDLRDEPDDQSAEPVDLGVLAAHLGTSEQRLLAVLVSGDVQGAVYLPDRRAWYLPTDVVEHLRHMA